MKKLIFNLLIITLMLFLSITLSACWPKSQKTATNFKECIQAGNPAMESYPRQCRTKEGQTFIEVLSPEEQAKVNPPDIVKPTTDEFCGWSTNETCKVDLDCVTGGCSGQVCRAEDGEDVITTCEAQACYDAAKYGYTCQCANQECKWDKEIT